MTHVNEEARPRGAVLLMANFSSSTGFAWNNIYELFDSLVKAADERGHRVYVSFASIDGACSRIQGVPESDYIELRPPGSGIADLVRLCREILRRRIRYVYLTDRQPAHWSYVVLRVLGVRAILVHCRVSVADPHPATRDPLPVWLAKHLHARLPGFGATRIYAVSEFVRDRLLVRARMPPADVVTILNGVDLQRFAPSRSPRPDPSKPLTIFAGARASPHKGIQILIEACARLREDARIGPFRLVYAGDGPYLETLKELAADKRLDGNVTFLGETESTEALISEADVVVVPSIWGDACPSSVSEALAAGKALVTTNAGGIPEIVGDATNAVIVEYGNATELARALTDLAQSPETREALGRRARQRALDALSKERYHRQVVAQFLSDLAPFEEDV